jgi:hypothetical protein
MPFTRELQNDLRAIGRIQGKNLCEINADALRIMSIDTG